ncbi:DoxX family protein [soil metagenome]
MIFGLLFLCHASAHRFGWPTRPAAVFGQWPRFYAGVLALVTGVLISLGLFTRVATSFASGTMAFALFTQHLPTSIIPMTNRGEPAVLYCFAFFLLIFTGGGAIALDTRHPAPGHGAVGGENRRLARQKAEPPAGVGLSR